MLRIGIVGCGQAAVRHAEALLHFKDRVRIVGCCDLDSLALMDFRKIYCPESDVFTDVNAMFMQQKLDMVLLSTWPVVHREQIVTAIECGVKTVVVEKPLTVTASEAFELFNLARAKNARIVESNAFIYQQRFTELKSLTETGAPTDTMHATFCKRDTEAMDPSEFDLDWRRRRVNGGGVPWEYATFLITACNHFAKDLPVGVYAYGSRGRYDTITRLHGMIEYLHGGVAFIHSDKQSDAQSFKLHKADVTVEVGGGCWFADSGSSSMTFSKDGRFEERSFDDRDVFRCQWDDVLKCLDSGVQLRVPFVHSVVAMYTLDAMVASVLQQVTVELDVPESVMGVYEASLKGDQQP